MGNSSFRIARRFQGWAAANCLQRRIKRAVRLVCRVWRRLKRNSSQNSQTRGISTTKRSAAAKGEAKKVTE